MHQEIHYQLLTLLEAQPDLSQRLLSQRLNVSLGKINYCLRALVDAGLIRPEAHPHSQPRRYRVTEQGRRSRMDAAQACLARKTHQLETLTREIELLERALSRDGKIDVRR